MSLSVHDLETAFRRALKRTGGTATQRKTRTSDIQAARDHLRRKGWTLRTAAPHLGVHWTRLHHVLKGDRKSASLLARVAALPKRQPAHR